jgi:hypothetical protein
LHQARVDRDPAHLGGLERPVADDVGQLKRLRKSARHAVTGGLVVQIQEAGVLQFLEDRF